MKPELKFEMNEDYKKLAQLLTIMQSYQKSDQLYISKTCLIYKILHQSTININYQIPNNIYFKVKQPKLIGCTALHFAQKKYRYDICKVLLQFGADFTIKNNLGETVFHQAIEFVLEGLDNYWGKIEYALHNRDEKDFVDWLLSSPIRFNNTRNPSNHYGISHFHIACLMNNEQVVQLFLESGESVNQVVNVDSPIASGYFPLHFAVRYFSVETVDILLKKGADKYLTDAKKMSPLHLLIKRNIEIIDYINYNHNSLISNEFIKLEENFNKNKKMISLLIEQDVLKGDNIVDSIGLSCFHVACTLQDVALVKTLFKEDSDIQHAISENSPFWPGYTAAHFAAHFDVETTYFLVNKGADMQVRDCKGVTPFDIFVQKYDVSKIIFIIYHQPQLKNVSFSDGKTKLTDLIFAMQKPQEFKLFLKKVHNLNTFVPFDSPLWPGYTPLHIAVALCSPVSNCLYTDIEFIHETVVAGNTYNYRTNNIKICLELGIDVNAQDVHGLTAIHLAFYKKRIDIVNLLLHRQSKICNVIDNNGLSLLHILCVNNKISRTSGCVANTLVLGESDINFPLKCRFVIVYEGSSSSRKVIYANAGSTPLHIAVNTRDFYLIEELLKSGADANSENIDHFTPIHQLLTLNINNDDKFIRQLLNKSSLLLSNLTDRVSACGLSHLHVACYVGSVEAVKMLLNCGADVNATIVPHLQIDGDHFTELEILLMHQKSIDLDSKRNSFSSGYYSNINSLAMINRYLYYKPLHFAVEFSRDYEIIDLLARQGADIMAKKANGSIIFYEALVGKDDRLKQIFITELECNCKLQKCVEKESGITMLHLACAILNVDTVEQLLNSKVNVNSYTKSDSPVWPSSTPLHVLMMISEKHSCLETRDSFIKIMKMLLDNRADVQLQNSDHRTPLHQSLPHTSYLELNASNLDLAKILLSHHKDFSINPIDDRGISHFHIACVCNDMTTVKLFLEHGVDINQATDYCLDFYGGYAPLHFAAFLGYEEITHLLLQYNANVNVRDCLMNNPLHVAFSQCPQKTYLEILLNAGVKTNEKNILEMAPLEVALAEIEERSLYNTYGSAYTLKEDILILITKYKICINVFYPKSQRGFIGEQLCNRKLSEKVLDNHLFKAVIHAPEENDLDSFGRNVIHNVVSCGPRRDRPTTDEYIDIIEQLAVLGFDIDHQAGRGFTPLHAATKFQNLKAIKSLLINGSDVNIVYADTKVPYTYNIKWDNHEDEDISDRSIRQMFFRHFLKLSLFGLDLHILNKKYLAEDDSDYRKAEMERYAVQVFIESHSLKNIKIEPYSITLYDFLSETGAIAAYPSMMKPEREAIVKYFQKNGEYLRKNFPELAGILYLQYRKALARMALIEPAIIALNDFIPYELPLLCSDAILRFLKNTDLKNVICA